MTALDEPPSSVAARPVASVLGAVARLRNGPAIHAVGTTYAARLEVSGSPDGWASGVELMDQPGAHPAMVRLSRGAGLPAALPDVLGFALRVDRVRADASGPQDLLLDSCWPGPWGRHMVRPGRSFTDGYYGSLLAYRVGGRMVHLAAVSIDAAPSVRRHDRASGRSFRLLLAEPYASQWRAWATVRLLEPVERPALRFSPAHDAAGMSLRPDGTRFRVPSYRASQRQGPFGG